MVVHLVAVGSVRDAHLREACADYARRTRRFMKLETHEVPAAGRRGTTAAVSRRLEAERLEAATPSDVLRVALTRTGTSLSSRALATHVGRWRDGGRDVALVIGGAFGLDPAFVTRCQHRISLSALTFPHELARLILLEQLYRACTILEGHPYHKDGAQ